MQSKDIKKATENKNKDKNKKTELHENDCCHAIQKITSALIDTMEKESNVIFSNNNIRTDMALDVIISSTVSFVLNVLGSLSIDEDFESVNVKEITRKIACDLIEWAGSIESLKNITH